MDSIPSFLRKDKDTLYFKGEGEFIFFVPEIFFERQCAIVMGEYVNLIGILDYAIVKTPNQVNNITRNLKTFNFPTQFLCKPGKIDKVKDFKIKETVHKAEDYRLLRFTDNGKDQIVVSTKVAQDITNVEEFFNLFIKTGNIPKSIPYDKLHEYFFESIRLNGGSYDTTAQLFGVIISEICRDPHNMKNPFRLSKAIDEDFNSYNSTSIINIPKMISPFTAITSQNWDESLIYACNMDPENVKDTPLERVMTKGYE